MWHRMYPTRLSWIVHTILYTFIHLTNTNHEHNHLLEVKVLEVKVYFDNARRFDTRP